MPDHAGEPGSEPVAGRALNGSVELYYEVFGDASSAGAVSSNPAGADQKPTFLLVNGLGSQLLSYPEDFCRALAAEGFRVVRFDNRDVGLSSVTPGPVPDLGAVRSQLEAGQAPEVPYTLSDMAADAVAVLDALGVRRAHVAGVSMGGMIVQTLAIEQADRLASATSIMSSPAPSIGPPTRRAWSALMSRPPLEREPWIEHQVATGRVISGPHFDEADAVTLQSAAYDRSLRPDAAGFQLAAVWASGSRLDELGSVEVPFLVIHGAMDELITPPGGSATAEAVPGARLVMIEDMGHDLSRGLWSRVIAEMVAHARGA